MKFWTPDEVDTLRSLWRRGWSLTDIGGQLGRTRQSISGKITQLGIQRCKTRDAALALRQFTWEKTG